MNHKIGHTIVEIDSLDSTNEEMNRRLTRESNLPSGLVIIAKNQTRGKGMSKNTWVSEEGKNLTFSFVIKPSFLLADQQFNLNMFVSLSVYELIKLAFPNKPVKIKWPNDIYVENKKVAGILISHAISGKQILSSIIGIGLNVNQTSFSEDLPNPVSMKQLAGQSFDISLVFRDLLHHLNNFYSLVKSGNNEEFREAYKFALFGYYKWLKFKWEDRIRVARITGISHLGLLQLETAEKERLECDLKEIEFII